MRFQVWKTLLVLFIVSLGIVFSLPNIFPPDPSVQITTSSVNDGFSDKFLNNLEEDINRSGLNSKSFEKNEKSILIRTNSYRDQLELKDYLQDELNENFIVALNLAANTPNWLKSINAKPMKLGLDLRGGVNFLMEVDTDLLIETKLESAASVLRNNLREERIKTDLFKLSSKEIQVVLRDENSAEDLEEIINEIGSLDFELKRPLTYLLSFSNEEIEQTIDYAVLQNLTTLRNRVNELGVSEPVVQREGERRISVQLPGIQDTAEAKKIIGKTANLEFRLEAKDNALASRTDSFLYRDLQTRLDKKVIISGDRVSDASVGFDENGFPQVNISLDSDGGAQMHRATRNNVGTRMAVLFVEKKSSAEQVGGMVSVKNYYEKRVISLATIQSALANQFRITGLDSPAEASELALLLRAGALAAPMNFVEEGTIGPSLGADNIELGINSLILGLSLVLIFMIFYYKVFGLLANLAVVLNLILIASIMSILSATLTLPGIAGIVLTIGMAVDANVLIFSRIREELKRNIKPLEAISSGYDRALITIVDANLTTLIVALILYIVGTGPVQGFAITLSVGILTSMFTAILFTRMLVFFIYGKRKNLEKIWI
ncbi:MAG: protein translocase subunit SecD [Gammaproteobacteria bacterium]|nr:protein translocase subunit SecD [Gammaproteobacteria bacterium]